MALLLLVALGVAYQRRPSAALADNASVAVLPFEDLSQQRTSEYFGDGIAETLISNLSSVPGLDVAARTSAFSFRGKNVDAREIARQLGVATVLEGSVQRAGDRLRISAQLVKASTGTNLWSATFDRSAADIFAVQDEVARAVVTALKGRLLAGQALVASEPTHDRQAYDLYLQGRFLWNRRAVPDLEQAIGLFEEALQRDSSFALAHAGLADAYIALAFYSNAPTLPTLTKARAAAERALALNPNLGEAESALAYLTFLEWHLGAADSIFRRAIRLNPGYATAHKWYSDLLLTDGRAAESMRELVRAKELDPLAAIIMANIGNWYWIERTGGDSALIWMDRALALDPNNPLALENSSSIYFSRGDSARFFKARERLDVSSSRGGAPVSELRKAWAAGGPNAVLRAQLASPRSQGLAVERARWRAELGDIDGAFRELDTGIAEHSIWIIYVDQFPELEPLHRDPRYAALRERVGLAKRSTVKS